MTAAPQSTSAVTADLWRIVAANVKERMAEGDGVWMTCTGCHESEDGYDNGFYPHSDVFGCKLGGGCGECGGIGAIWDTTDYGAMADALHAEMIAPQPAQGWEVEIRVNGDSVLTIGHNHLAGVENIDDHKEVVENCARHLLSFIGGSRGVAQQPVPCGEPIMWVCLVAGPAPAGAEMRIRAWTADRKRMESLRDEGLDMQALYTSPAPSSWQPTDAMIEAGARELWNDRDARMGGSWDSRDPREVCVIQTKATMRAALTAALAVSSTEGKTHG